MNISEEQVDIVNENDEVTGNTSKREAHEKGLLHRTVISEVHDTEGRWILVKQASDRQDAGQYVSPVGGHIQAGESLVDALKREALEEMGLSETFEYKLVGKSVFNRNVLGRQENHLFILFEITTRQTPTLNHESESYRAFTVKELRKELKENPSSFGAAFHFVVERFYKSILL